MSVYAIPSDFLMVQDLLGKRTEIPIHGNPIPNPVFESPYTGLHPVPFQFSLKLYTQFV
jgi:hypothetical protein